MRVTRHVEKVIFYLRHLAATDGAVELLAQDPHPGGAAATDGVVARPNGEDLHHVVAHRTHIVHALRPLPGCRHGLYPYSLSLKPQDGQGNDGFQRRDAALRWWRVRWWFYVAAAATCRLVLSQSLDGATRRKCVTGLNIAHGFGDFRARMQSF